MEGRGGVLNQYLETGGGMVRCRYTIQLYAKYRYAKIAAKRASGKT